MHRAAPKNVEFALKEKLRKKEEGKARLRAAASGVGDAPTGRALKRVRFAENQDHDNVEVPETLSESVSTIKPLELRATSSSSGPTTSVNDLFAAVVVSPRKLMSNEPPFP